MSRALFSVLILIAACTSPEKVKYERYRVAGERLYLQKCASCHKMDGTGFQELYPPITGTDWIIENFEQTICLLKYGQNDSLVINGIQYTLPMKSLDLTDLEVAEISTFMYNSWGNDMGLIDVNQVSRILRDCKDKTHH